jgi:hypothetical protein
MIVVVVLGIVGYANRDKPYVLTVHTKGAEDLVYMEHFDSFKMCLLQSKLMHDGGYEINCRDSRL